MRYILVLSALLLALVACDDDSGDGEPPGSQSPSISAAASPAPPAVGTFDDANDFRSFGALLNNALRTGDLDFFLDNAVFEDFTCPVPEAGGFPAPPESCRDAGAGAIVPAINVGVEQSEGYLADEAQYRELIREFLEDFVPGSLDVFGEATPRVYAYGVIRPEFGGPAAGEDEVAAVATGIYPPIRGGDAQRQVRLFEATFVGNTWRITSVVLTPLLEHLDPTSPDAVAGGFDSYKFWSRWDAVTATKPLLEAVADVDAALRSQDLGFFVSSAVVSSIVCPQEPPAFDECLPGDGGPAQVRRQCKFGSDCGGFQKDSYLRLLRDELSAVDESAPPDEFGEAGWRVYAYGDAQPERSISGGAIATALVKPADGPSFRQVMFVALEPAGKSWVIPYITIGTIEVNGLPVGLAPDADYYPAQYWHRRQ